MINVDANVNDLQNLDFDFDFDFVFTFLLILGQHYLIWVSVDRDCW